MLLRRGLRLRLCLWRRRLWQHARPHQASAIDAAVREFVDEGATRATVVLPSGAGKTLVGAGVLTALCGGGGGGDKLGVLVTPTLALVAQALREYERWAPDLVEGAVVVASRGVKHSRRSTDPNALSSWLEQKKSTRLAVSTYASLPRLARALEMAGREVLVAVLDEAHVTTYASRTERSSGFEFAVDHELWPVRHRLFVTATPRVLVSGDASRSMDDVRLYGRTVREMTCAQAVREGVTVPIELVVVDSTSARAPTSAAARDAEVAVAVRRVYEERGASRAFCFSNSNRRAAQFCATARTVWADAGIEALRVDSLMGATERERILAHVRDDEGKRVVVNARLLATGVDAPRVDAVVFRDPRRSHVDVAQAVGRAARAAPGKKKGIVVVPVRVDPSNEQADLEASDFATVVAVVRALVADVGALGEGWRAAAARGPEDVVDFASSLNASGAIGDHAVVLDARLPSIKRRLDAALRTVALELSADKGWNARFAELADQLRESGEPGLSSNKWLAAQRRNCRLGVLSLDKMNALDDLLGGVSWRESNRRELVDDKFDAYLEKWRAYAAAKLKSRTAKMPAGLSHWIGRQHRNRDGGKLSSENNDALQKAGFFDAPRSTKRRPSRIVPLDDDAVFAAALDLYQNHLRETGKPPPVTSSVPIVYRDDRDRAHPVSLGGWVRAMRLRRDDLDDRKRDMLHQAGFVFNARDHAFDEFLARLVEFKRERGHLAVPRDYPLIGHHVARTIRNRAKLHPDRVRALDDLGFPWTAADRAEQRRRA